MRRNSARKAVCSARAVAIAVIAAFAVAVPLSSCATGSVPVPEDPFAPLGAGATMWFSFPVAQNRELASLIAGAAGGDGMSDALDRTEVVYGASWPDGEIRVLARGDYPRSLSRLAFPRSKGWTKASEAGIGTWYSRDGVDVSIPRSGLACVVRGGTGGGMESVVAGLRNPGVSPVPADFASFARDGADSGGIFLFVSDARPWVARLLGPDVTLPVESALVAAYPEPIGDETSYAVSVAVTAKDERSARAMLTVMRLAFPRCEVSAEGRVVRVGGISAGASALVDFAGNLYF